MAKIKNDKYYTSKDLANYIVTKTKEIIGAVNITEYIEPSAGAGVFLDFLDKSYVAYDIFPEDDRIIQQDYLTLDLEYKKGRCVIGNPPFGSRNSLSVKFFKKSIKIADYIAFIQPISQLNSNEQMYEFDLIYSKDLGLQEYSGIKLHCCFNIYKRPENSLLNKKKSNKLDTVILIQDRGKRGYKDTNYDFRICIWGQSCGRVLKDDEKYSKETAFYIKDKEKVDTIKSLFSQKKVNEYFKFISTPYLPNSMIYKYLKDKIPELY